MKKIVKNEKNHVYSKIVLNIISKSMSADLTCFGGHISWQPLSSELSLQSSSPSQ